MARRHRTRKHKSKKRHHTLDLSKRDKRQTRRKQHRGGSKLVPLLSRFTSSITPYPGSGLANYTATNKKRMNELRKYYAELNRQENEELARKEKEAVQQRAYAAELKRTAGLQKLAQEENAELANIQRKFKQGKFVPLSNQAHLEQQLAYLQELENLERSASRASNPGSVGYNSN
jgi:hypothetical protein